MPVNICQYVFASVLFCQYIFASGFFCQQNLLVYFASNFLPATYGQQFLPATFASGYFYSFLLNRRHVVIVDTLNLSELALKVLTSSQKALKLYISVKFELILIAIQKSIFSLVKCAFPQENLGSLSRLCVVHWKIKKGQLLRPPCIVHLQLNRDEYCGK